MWPEICPMRLSTLCMGYIPIGELFNINILIMILYFKYFSNRIKSFHSIRSFTHIFENILFVKTYIWNIIWLAIDIIQLPFQVLMGIFFYIKSVALVEDLPLEGKYFTTKDEFYTEAERGYTQNAYNCWIAACIYVLTFLFSGYQFYLNSRSSLSV